MKIVKRQLEKEIEPFLKRREIIAIVGPRQAGKTTLLLQLKKKLEKKGKKVAYITFEDQETLSLFENPKTFLSYFEPHEIILIDEFHYAKEGGKKLKFLFDTSSKKFIITGSSSLEITFSAGKYLVGRMLKFYLPPFTWQEYILSKDENLFRPLQSLLLNWKDLAYRPLKMETLSLFSKLKPLFESYLVYGSFPSVALTENPKEKEKILESIVDNYLLKEIKLLLNLENHTQLLTLAKFLAAQIGGLTRFNELSNISGLPYQKLLKFLSILENTFVINLLRPYFTNPKTELKKNPKIYFEDLGWRNFLLKRFSPLPLREDIGQLTENFVFLQIKRNFSGNIYYWRSKSKAEVDFVLEKEGEIIPIEVKYSPKPSLTKSFYSFISKYKPKRAFVISQKFEEIKIQNTKVIIYPIWLI